MNLTKYNSSSEYIHSAVSNEVEQNTDGAVNA